MIKSHAQAVEVGRLSGVQRRRNREILQRFQAAEALYQQPTVEQGQQIVEHTNDYRIERLIRVRKQLDRIDKMMMSESDPGKLDRLASAQARLAEQERVIRGEPLPGSRRPRAESAPRRQLPVSYDPTPAPTGGRELPSSDTTSGPPIILPPGGSP